MVLKLSEHNEFYEMFCFKMVNFMSHVLEQENNNNNKPRWADQGRNGAVGRKSSGSTAGKQSSTEPVCAGCAFLRPGVLV